MPAVDELVVLLDVDRTPIGTQSKASVHGADTPLHLAFSLYLRDADGRVLFTRRGLGKRTWPGVWTNSCCGHPGPGEVPADAVARRLEAELGLRLTGLRCVLPDFAYRARDASGIWENEVCPVYLAEAVGDLPSPDPDEVAEWAWVAWPDIVTAVQAAPFAFSPWCVEQIAQLGALDLLG